MYNLNARMVLLSKDTLYNHRIQTAQSSSVGCSRLVKRRVYLAVKNGNIVGQFITSEKHSSLIIVIYHMTPRLGVK